MQKNKLYLKISATLLALLVVLGVTYVMITGFVARQYHQEVNQRLYGNIAPSMAHEVNPFIEGGGIDTVAIHNIMHSMMIVNPSVEVYLLDTLGNIITYVAPYKRVKLESVSLSPITEFIAAEEKPFIKGDNPRFPGEQSVFSAARVEKAGLLQGYFYIILASEEQSAITSTLSGSYMLKLGANMFFITLFGALAIGLLAIWLLTKSLRNIIHTVKRFKEGDHDARIAENEKGDLNELADSFNEMADTIVANIDQLKSVEKLRRELIANVSHDLRTPVSIIQGYVETLLIKKEVLKENDRDRYMNIVLDSTEKLSTQIDQLFEYSKLEAKQIEPQKEAFFLSDLVQDIYQKYQILAQSKDITLNTELPTKAQLVFADVQLVERVLQNLLDNALKYTPEGGAINIQLENSDHSVKVSVSDTGPGIPENEQSYIFERYRKVKGVEKKTNSTGLGLAIVKKILELHNVSIQVKSKVNEGAAFVFNLPVYSGA